MSFKDTLLNKLSIAASNNKTLKFENPYLIGALADLPLAPVVIDALALSSPF